MLRDIDRASPDVSEAADRIANGQADVLVLLGFDYDYYGVALSAFSQLTKRRGAKPYPYQFALRPNSGMASVVDLDMDGRIGTPRDAQSYGNYSGEGGMAILSRYPIRNDEVEDYSDLIWSEISWASLPTLNGEAYYSDEALATQRLSTRGHWVVPIGLPNGVEFRLMIYHATAPVFDGSEDRNGYRNADETRFWIHYLDQVKYSNFAIVGNANLDPREGEGNRNAIRALLEQPNTQDPFGNANNHTVDWSDIDLGKMRVSYILPSSKMSASASGMTWPETTAEDASRHALIWVDIDMPTPTSAHNLETSDASQ
ncbi:MAG: endonuclease/exonuclease/phosphatase family protein [Paracoccaceae bacterium]|nr:endonuclease/exonuclease/phosphatase family protein [Paracoccaceae bacterium]